MGVQGCSFLGLRTNRFGEMVALYRDALRLPVLHEAETAVWFGMEDGGEIHVYPENDADHAFFDSAPVVGLLVDDFVAARLRLIAAGCTFLGEPQETAAAIWNHYRAPDGNLYEIMQRF